MREPDVAIGLDLWTLAGAAWHSGTSGHSMSKMPPPVTTVDRPVPMNRAYTVISKMILSGPSFRTEWITEKSACHASPAGQE